MACYVRVPKWFTDRFRNLGILIGSHPIKLIALSLIVTAGLSCGMFKLTSESDTETLYTPVGSQASKDREKIQAVFEDDSGSNFFPRSLTKSDLYGDVIFSDVNVVDEDSLSAIRFYIDHIKNITVTLNNIQYSYSDVCARRDGSCYRSGDTFNGSITGGVTYPVFNNVDLSSVLGNVNAKDGKLVSAGYLEVTFHLRQDSVILRAAAIAWEDEFIKVMSTLKPENVTMSYAASQSLNKELDANTGGDITYFSITFTLMITYATIIVGGDMVSSRTWVSWAGVLAAGMGIASSLGLVSLCGMKFVNIVGTMPFLVLGIGVDDMFLLMSSWADTYPHHDMSVANRIGMTFASAGIGITITSLTDLLAFIIGTSSVFISVRNFCVYTGVAVIFCYLYQCFFFAPCLSLHGSRVDARRHCLTCLRVKSRLDYREENKHCLYVYSCGGTRPKEREQDERICETGPRKILPVILLHVAGKITVVVVYLSYLGVSIYGLVNLKQGLDLKNLVSPSSHFYSYTDIKDTYFPNTFPIPFIFEDTTNYLNKDTITQINKLLADAQSDSEVNSQSSVCWLTNYMNSSYFDDTSGTTFVSGAQYFLNETPAFKNDVAFNGIGEHIIASRCYLFSDDIKDSNKQARVMTRMRELADGSPLSVYTYYPAFIFFEQYVAILPSTLQTVGVALVVMTVVTCIFMPHPLMITLVVFNIVSILVGIFGFLYFWDLSLSSVTMIHLIMSVGFSVDFSVHVCSAFLLGERQHSSKKVKYAIVHASGPVLNGAISSFLGVIILVLSESYIFKSFFNIMLTVMLLGMLHAVFLLPVVLSLVGPTESPGKATEARHPASSQQAETTN
ncbi:LOW QUALITY PROTEIN: patched domain-containing protein 3-like [Haliotis rubra]|uniref:LOW QUALITY PROTEIN: patched domain-containing protein 3-like n=1 Tax=Haliotis rubra TaxID=36100 RepID=UPI001EE56CB9|nr:LOW QUALITY PROTEIN: patched domain-containing protein 3-like [Haliotis rubra]